MLVRFAFLVAAGTRRLSRASSIGTVTVVAVVLVLFRSALEVVSR